MVEWIETARAAVGRGERLAMVTIVGAKGSTPREVGARLLVWPDRFLGTIGGGSLERLALEQARALLGQNARRYATQDYPLGPLLGQCCGGWVRVLVEEVSAESRGWLDEAAAACDAGAPFRLETRLGAAGVARGVRRIDQEPDPMPDPISELISPAPPPLLIFGAGHVGQAVARAFQPLPFALTWLASREDLRPDAAGARARLMAEPALEDAIAAAPAEALYAIFTHSHDLDYRLTRAVLRRGDFRYLGLIGSQTKRARFLRRFRDDGVAEDVLGRLTCPLGLQGLKSKAPAVIAVSLAAELLQFFGDEYA